MAVYRPDQQLLARQIETIRAQSVTMWTCLVGIDGSDPATDRIVRELVAGDERFVIFEYQKNVGFYRNFERLLREVPSEARWVALADQDDEWFPRKLEVLLPRLDDADLVAGQAFIVRPGDSASQVTARKSTGLAAILIDNQVTGSLSVFRRSLLNQALPFPEPTDAAYHDHWLGLCAVTGEGLLLVDDVVQNYIQHGSNVIGEEGRARLRVRTDALVRRAGRSLGSQADYLAVNRWGWRSRAASTLLERGESQNPADDKILSAFARGGISISLIAIAGRQMLARRVPALRTVAILVGAARAGQWHRRGGLAGGQVPKRHG